MAKRPRARLGTRLFVALLLLLAMGTLYGGVAVSLRWVTQADLDVATSERQGAAYAGPVGQLIGELVAARSAAVRGAPVDAASLVAAVAAVSDVDRTSGEALHTRQRWTDLHTKIDLIVSQAPTGQAALVGYTDLVALATDLCRRVADASALTLDPDLDAHYLVDAATQQVPAVLAAAGLAADRAQLARAADPDPAGTLVDIAVGRQQAAAATEAAASGIRTALEATARGELAPHLTAPLDAFRAAVAELVPPTTLRPATTPADADVLAAAVAKLRQAGRPLLAALVGELDALLITRQDALAERGRLAAGAAVAGVVLGGVLLTVSILARVRARGDAALDVVSLATGLPEVDARDLLTLEDAAHAARRVDHAR
jgi:hypothetical protein